MSFSQKRRLLMLESASSLATGCAKYTRYQERVKNYEERHKKDRELARAAKTVTVLSRKTDRDVSLSVVKSLIPMREHVEELKRRKPEYLKALRAAIANVSFAAEMAEVVGHKLALLGYSVDTVFSDGKTETNQAMREADFGTDLVVALSAPQISISINVLNIGLDRYFIDLAASSSVIRAHTALALGARRASPELGDQYRPYLLADQWDRPETVRRVLMHHMNEVADRLLQPFEA